MYKLQKPETEDLKTILCSHKNLVFKVYLQNLPPAASSGCMATKKDPPDLFVVCLATENDRQLLAYRSLYDTRVPDSEI